jgi:hypothetical protein
LAFGDSQKFSQYCGFPCPERYMDPNDSRIPDYAAAPGTASPDGF